MKLARILRGRGWDQLIGRSERHPELGNENLFDAVKRSRRDAHNCVIASREQNGLAKDRLVTVKAVLPKILSQYDDRSRIVTGDKPSAEDHGKSEDIKEIGGDRLAPDAFGLALAVDRCRYQCIIGGNPRERFCLIAHILIDRIGELATAAVPFARR